MKRDLVKLGRDLEEKVPFHPIIREFEYKGAKFRIRVGYGISKDARIEAWRGMGQDKEWVEEDWSIIPRSQLLSLTKSIKAEAAGLLQGMDALIEKECEAEIKEMVTDVICKTGTTKDRQAIFIEAMNHRVVKMSQHFQTYARPSTFSEFTVKRAFTIPKPAYLPKDYQDNYLQDEEVTIIIDENSFRTIDKVVDMHGAMSILLTMPQIAEFGLQVYSQLAKLAEWEAKNDKR